MVSNFIKISLLFGMAMLLSCSLSNPAVEKSYNEYNQLLKEKKALEKEYFITLGHLQKFPNERVLRLQQAELKTKLSEINLKIKESRSQLDFAIKEWEQKVADVRAEKQLIEGEERRSGSNVRRRNSQTADESEFK